MNSLQKQERPQGSETPESYVMSFEKKLALMIEHSEVDLLYKKLKYLGLNFDPFNPEIPKECQEVMDNLGLADHLKNPYLATNILLRLLDKTEEQLNKLKQ
jgi:hypothetical protein